MKKVWLYLYNKTGCSFFCTLQLVEKQAETPCILTYHGVFGKVLTTKILSKSDISLSCSPPPFIFNLEKCFDTGYNGRANSDKGRNVF